MQVYGYKNNKKEGIMEVENTQKALSDFVQGDIEVVSLTSELSPIYNKNNPPYEENLTVAWFDNDNGEVIDIILGNCLVCKKAGNTLSSIRSSDISIIKKLLR